MRHAACNRGDRGRHAAAGCLTRRWVRHAIGCDVVVPRVVLAVLAALVAVTFTHQAAEPADAGDGARPATLTELDMPSMRSASRLVAPETNPTGDGFLVLDRSRPAIGHGISPVTYSVEVEPDLRDEAANLQQQVELALDDRERGWATQQSLKQVADPDQAQIRVLLANPATVDALCALAGFYTGGQLSCWNGRFAALNVMRWRQAAPGFESVAQYRIYQINHEFGHGLGRMHEYCPGPGAKAPVMMQQTKGLLGCRPNEWPQP